MKLYFNDDSIKNKQKQQQQKNTLLTFTCQVCDKNEVSGGNFKI